MPRKAVLPTALPDQDGDVAAVIAAPDTLRLKLITVPSDRVKEKFCPDADRAVVSL